MCRSFLKREGEREPPKPPSWRGVARRSRDGGSGINRCLLPQPPPAAAAAPSKREPFPCGGRPLSQPCGLTAPPKGEPRGRLRSCTLLPLPLGEVARRSRDGEGHAAPGDSVKRNSPKNPPVSGLRRCQPPLTRGPLEQDRGLQAPKPPLSKGGAPKGRGDSVHKNPRDYLRAHNVRPYTVASIENRTGVRKSLCYRTGVRTTLYPF